MVDDKDKELIRLSKRIKPEFDFILLIVSAAKQYDMVDDFIKYMSREDVTEDDMYEYICSIPN